jgi:hypothetical protein
MIKYFKKLNQFRGNSELRAELKTLSNPIFPEFVSNSSEQVIWLIRLVIILLLVIRAEVSGD